MRKWLVFVMLLGGLVFPSQAGAQGGIKLKTVEVNLLSEYDQPSMLVIHEFTLDENTPLPAEVTVRFPKDGNLTAVAYRNGDLPYDADYDGPESQGSWQIVTLKVESYVPHFIEYYQPLVRDGDQRSFTYRWFGDYPVAEFSVITQIPADSAEITANPPFTNSFTSQDGKHAIGVVTQNNLMMGQSSEFKISYERDSETITKPSNSANVQPSEQIGSNTEGRVSIDRLPWMIGGFGLALIGLALFFYWRSTQVTEHKSRRRNRSGSGMDAGGEQAYCQECGTRAHPGDRFCRTCGSKLRV
jgi:hypothetical protein